MVEVRGYASITHTCDLLRRIVQTTTQVFEYNAYLRKRCLIHIMSQNNATSERTERDKEKGRRGDVYARGRVSTGST